MMEDAGEQRAAGSTADPAGQALPNAVPESAGAAALGDAVARLQPVQQASALPALEDGALRSSSLEDNKKLLRKKVKGMGMIGSIRRGSIIASTYGTEIDLDTLSPMNRDSAIEDHGATLLMRERTGRIGRMCPVCNPEKAFRKRWDIAQVVALVYVAVLVPVRTGFAELDSMELKPFHFNWFLDAFVDLYFIVDIFVNFRTGYIDADGMIENRPGLIARHYLRTWFTIDIVSCLPVSYVAQAMESEKQIPVDPTAVRILRLLKLTKLLRLSRMKSLIRKYEDYIEGIGSFIKLVSACVVVLFTAHLIACLWHLVGGDERDPRGELVLGWISQEWPQLAGHTVNGDPTPLFNRTLVNQVTFGDRYLVAVYWSITTLSTVGFGDVTPNTRTERIFNIFAMIFGCLMFATIIGTVSSVAMGQKLLEEKVTRQLAELREFLQSKGINKPLRIRVRRFMETLYTAKSGFDEAEVLRQLPPPMAQEVLHCLYHDQISAVPMFRALEDGALNAICMRMRPFKAMKEDWIYRVGEAGREIYIIIEGAVALRSEVIGVKPRLMQSGAVFGEDCVVQLLREVEERNAPSQPDKRRRKPKPHVRSQSATAEKDCDLRFLTLNDLDDVGRSYPSLVTELQSLHNKRRRHSAEIRSNRNAALLIQASARGWLVRKRMGRLSPKPLVEGDEDEEETPSPRLDSEEPKRAGAPAQVETEIPEAEKKSAGRALSRLPRSASVDYESRLGTASTAKLVRQTTPQGRIFSVCWAYFVACGQEKQVFAVESKLGAMDMRLNAMDRGRRIAHFVAALLCVFPEIDRDGMCRPHEMSRPDQRPGRSHQARTVKRQLLRRKH